MIIIVTNNDDTPVPMSSLDGSKPWATTLYPHQPAPIGQPAIKHVTVGDSTAFREHVGGKLLRLRQWVERALLHWHGPRSEGVVRVGIENIGPAEIDVIDSAGSSLRVAAGALLQIESPNYLSITEVTP